MQNLFPKVSDSVYIRLFHECMAWQGGGFDPLEALTGGAFDVKTGNIAGNLTKIFQKSQMPGGLPGGGMGGFEIDRYIIPACREQNQIS